MVKDFLTNLGHFCTAILHQFLPVTRLVINKSKNTERFQIL